MEKGKAEDWQQATYMHAANESWKAYMTLASPKLACCVHVAFCQSAVLLFWGTWDWPCCLECTGPVELSPTLRAEYKGMV